MYWKYFRTMSKHRWFVFLECIKIGKQSNNFLFFLQMTYRGLVHDLSKYLPSEFIPYARYFNGDRKTKPAYYKPYETGDEAFDFAWLNHQKRNKHHWQWWILPKDDGGTVIFPMKKIYAYEMLCDWRGAGRTYNSDWNLSETKKWYLLNKENMRLHPSTRDFIESMLDIEEIK